MRARALSLSRLARYSAKDSRRKRKEYIEKLEAANNQLHSRLSKLGGVNSALKKQLHHFHQLIQPGAKTKAAGNKATSLMMLCLVFSRKAQNLGIDIGIVPESAPAMLADLGASSAPSSSPSSSSSSTHRMDESGNREETDDVQVELTPVRHDGAGTFTMDDSRKRLVVDAAAEAGLAGLFPHDALSIEAAMAFAPSFSAGGGSREPLPYKATPGYIL